MFTINTPTIPTLNNQAFPVGRIFCVGQNYAAHAIEMGGDPTRNPPFFFTKWSTALVNAALQDNASIAYPSDSENLHPEIELAVAIDKGGKAIDPQNALSHIFGFGVSLDMTKRDIQGAAKKAGRPWMAGKNFDFSCPISRIDNTTEWAALEQAKIELKVNGETRQSSTLNHMIWGVADIIAKLSNHIELLAGDFILTGTPEGVAPVVKGDHLQAYIGELPELSVKIA